MIAMLSGQELFAAVDGLVALKMESIADIQKENWPCADSLRGRTEVQKWEKNMHVGVHEVMEKPCLQCVY